MDGLSHRIIRMSHNDWWSAPLAALYARWSRVVLVDAGLAGDAMRPDLPHFLVAHRSCLLVPLSPGLRYRVAEGDARRWQRLGRDQVFVCARGAFAQRDSRGAFDQLKIALEDDRVELVRNRSGTKAYHDVGLAPDRPHAALATILDQAWTDPTARHAAWGLLLAEVLAALRTPPRRRATGTQRVHLLCVHLRDHLGEVVSRDQLAALAGCHRSHVTRLFQQHAGCGYLEWLERERLALARALLATTDLPLDAIAVRSGFGSATYLIRRFKAAHDATPGRWRESRRRDT